jgi:hypothetical protein
MSVFEKAPHKVSYSKDGVVWSVLSDTYEHYARAATIATALENRGYKTRIEKGA